MYDTAKNTAKNTPRQSSATRNASAARPTHMAAGQSLDRDVATLAVALEPARQAPERKQDPALLPLCFSRCHSVPFRSLPAFSTSSMIGGFFFSSRYLATVRLSDSRRLPDRLT